MSVFTRLSNGNLNAKTNLSENTNSFTIYSGFDGTTYSDPLVGLVAHNQNNHSYSLGLDQGKLSFGVDGDNKIDFRFQWALKASNAAIGQTIDLTSFTECYINIELKAGQHIAATLPVFRTDGPTLRNDIGFYYTPTANGSATIMTGPNFIRVTGGYYGGASWASDTVTKIVIYAR